MANGHGPDPGDQPILRALQEQAARRDATAAPGGGPRLGPLGEIGEMIFDYLSQDHTEGMERVVPAKVPDVVADASLPLYGTTRRAGQVVNMADELGFLSRLPGVGDAPAIEVGERLMRAQTPEAIEKGFRNAEFFSDVGRRSNLTGTIEGSRAIGASEAFQSERGRAILSAMQERFPKEDPIDLIGRIDQAAIDELLSQIP